MLDRIKKLYRDHDFSRDEFFKKNPSSPKIYRMIASVIKAGGLNTALLFGTKMSIRISTIKDVAKGISVYNNPEAKKKFDLIVIDYNDTSEEDLKFLYNKMAKNAILIIPNVEKINLVKNFSELSESEFFVTDDEKSIGVIRKTKDMEFYDKEPIIEEEKDVPETNLAPKDSTESDLRKAALIDQLSEFIRLNSEDKILLLQKEVKEAKEMAVKLIGEYNKNTGTSIKSLEEKITSLEKENKEIKEKNASLEKELAKASKLTQLVHDFNAEK